MKQITFILILAALFASGLSCAQNQKGTPTKRINQDTSKNKTIMTNYFPFKIRENNGQFAIIAEIESPELYPKYTNIFEKH